MTGGGRAPRRDLATRRRFAGRVHSRAAGALIDMSIKDIKIWRLNCAIAMNQALEHNVGQHDRSPTFLSDNFGVAGVQSGSVPNVSGAPSLAKISFKKMHLILAAEADF
jgi:hypothetical protein